MNGLRTVSFEVLVECVDLASGNPDAFIKLLLERTGDLEKIAITDKGKPCFLIQPQEQKDLNTVQWIDAYASELDLRM